MKSKSRFDTWFLLRWRKFGILVLLWLFSVAMHNFYFAIFGYEEAVFFIIAVFLVPLYFVVMVVYTIVWVVRKRK